MYAVLLNWACDNVLSDILTNTTNWNFSFMLRCYKGQTEKKTKSDQQFSI